MPDNWIGTIILGALGLLFLAALYVDYQDTKHSHDRKRLDRLARELRRLDQKDWIRDHRGE